MRTLSNPLRPYLKTAQRVAYRVTSPLRAPRVRVYGIGLSRTGTKSLHHALRLLGYRSDHFSTHLLEWRADAFRLDVEAAVAYEALTDVTAAYFYRELDQRFPGSKFILTLRDLDDWLRSCELHFGSRSDRHRRVHPRLMSIRRRLFGTAVFDRELFKAAYGDHCDRVRSYFAGRPRDLLELDICAGQHWRPLCSFLETPPPARPFPWSNRRP
jgi:hypothetical protein